MNSEQLFQGSLPVIKKIEIWLYTLWHGAGQPAQLWPTMGGLPKLCPKIMSLFLILSKWNIIQYNAKY